MTFSSSVPRCPSCGSRMDSVHLRNCKFVWKKPAPLKEKPTVKMVDFAKGLLLSLGYDEEEYDFDSMTYQQCGDLIDQLKKERG